MNTPLMLVTGALGAATLVTTLLVLMGATIRRKREDSEPDGDSEIKARYGRERAQ